MLKIIGNQMKNQNRKIAKEILINKDKMRMKVHTMKLKTSKNLENKNLRNKILEKKGVIVLMRIQMETNLLKEKNSKMHMHRM